MIHKIKKHIENKTDKTYQVMHHRSFNMHSIALFSFLGVALIFTFFLYGACLKASMEKYDVAFLNIREMKIKNLVMGSPLEAMAAEISKFDNKTSAFIVAIAKKESDWGKHSPKKDGRDCYNYWGYRGTYNKTRSGYSCFDSPEQAVDVVGAQIEDFVEKDVDTPKEMVVWKCGYDCAGHSSYDVNKWISDVNLYFEKMSN